MKHPARARPQTPGAEDGKRTIEDSEELTTVLSALEDTDCRSILAATSEQPLSASELSDACDLPLSTTYRKLDTLTETGLLQENIRISSSGKHASEYTLSVEDLHLSIDGESGITLHISRDESAESISSLLAGAD